MSGIVAQNAGRHAGLIKAASAGGAWTLIETKTASSDSTLSFTSGIDSTYDEYCFHFINIHPSDDGATFSFQGSIDSGSNYNVTHTSVGFQSAKPEDDGTAVFAYVTDHVGQGTGFRTLITDIGNDNDQSGSGYLYLFNPASTTFVKHFSSRGCNSQDDDVAGEWNYGGYFNTTSAVDAVQFKMSAGDIDSGTFSLFGIG